MEELKNNLLNKKIKRALTDDGTILANIRNSVLIEFQTDVIISACINCQNKDWRQAIMKDFPDFMKNEKNRVPGSAQNTEDIEGYYYEGLGGGQMAFWTCYSDRESKKHKHDFDEYTIIVSGQYTACFEDREIVLNPGDELFVPAGTVQWGRCIAGTRSIHAFGGKRIKTE